MKTLEALSRQEDDTDEGERLHDFARSFEKANGLLLAGRPFNEASEDIVLIQGKSLRS